jgi:hypothetical protein
MDPVKKFRIVFWVTFSVLVLIIAAGVFYYFKIDDWKEKLVASKDQKIAFQVTDLANQAKLLEETGGTAKDKEALVAENTLLTKDKASLTAENTALKAGRAKALAYNEFFKYLNTVIETHNGFTGWTDAEFQIGRTRAEATGDISFVSTVNWAWYETSINPTTRVIRAWKEIVSGIQNALK